MITERSERLEALDIFRGMTVAGMLLVNNPGSWGAIYSPLAHAAWHGWTAADLIFPFFLFIVGITTFLSIEARRRRGANDRQLAVSIVRRGVLIILIGLALNAFPFISPPADLGVEEPTIAMRIAHRFDNLRFSGVLQRIGIVYLVAALFSLRTTRRQQLIAVAALLAGYWIVMMAVPVPGSGATGRAAIDHPAGTMAAHFDRLLLGPTHIWKGGKSWDPEGPLSTLPAIATTLIGFLFAGRMKGTTDREGVTRLVLFGAAVSIGGLALAPFFPINKNIWSGSYVLFTAGLAAVTLSGVIVAVRHPLFRRLGAFFLPFGVNPMLAFVGSGVMTRLITSMIHVEQEGRPRVLQRVIYETTFASWLSPAAASLAYGLCFVMVWFAILLPLQQKRIHWKI